MVIIACAALISARASLEGGDVQNAKSRLQWTLDNTKEDELKDLVRLRLAGMLLDERKYDDALRLLDTKHGESFGGLYGDLKGDVLTAAGKVSRGTGCLSDSARQDGKKRDLS